MRQFDISIHDIGAANFIPGHLPLESYATYYHFEPDQRGIDNLQAWLQKHRSNASHNFFRIGLSDSEKTVRFRLEEKNTGSKVEADNAMGGASQIEVARHKVMQEREEMVPPNIIKIDVEGHELEVLSGIDLTQASIKLIEIEVTLDATRLDKVLGQLFNEGFKLERIRTHGLQTENPRNWFRGKVQGLTRRLGIPFYGVAGSEDCWSKIPSTTLTQVELVVSRNLDRKARSGMDSAICDAYGLARRTNKETRLFCGARPVGFLTDLFFIR